MEGSRAVDALHSRKASKPTRLQTSIQTTQTEGDSTIPGFETHVYVCGNNQNQQDRCPAIGKQCGYCKKYNHFAVVCRQKDRNKQKKKVHEVNDMFLDQYENNPNSDSDDESQYFVDGIQLDKGE